MVTTNLKPTLEKVMELHRHAPTSARRLYASAAVMWWAWRAGNLPEMSGGKPWRLVVNATDGAAVIGVVAGHEPETVEWMQKAIKKIAKPQVFLIRVGRDRHTKLPQPEPGVQLIDLRG